MYAPSETVGGLDPPPLKSRPQRNIRESFKRGWYVSAPSWAASDSETALRAHRARGAAVCTMAWGAGRCATGGLGGVIRMPRLRFFAGCMLAREARCRAGSRVCLGPTLRETRTCVADCSIKGVPAEHYTAAVSNLSGSLPEGIFGLGTGWQSGAACSARNAFAAARLAAEDISVVFQIVCTAACRTIAPG